MGKWLTRPVLEIRVEPGAREAYAEAGAAPPAEPAAAPAAPAAEEPQVSAGTRTEPTVGEIGNLDFPSVERTRLSNGVELVYARRTAVPITQVALSFDAGVTADRADKLGTQSLMLSLLDEGTRTRDSIRIAEEKERLGTAIGAASTNDRTVLSLNAPSPNLAPALELFSDVVRNPAFDPAEVTRLKNQQLARIAAELSDPNGLARRHLPPLIYGPASPYAKTAAGSGDAAAVATLTPAELVSFHQAWIRPDKARIFVVSDLSLAEVKAALEARFGDWRATGAAGTKPAAESVQASPRIVLVDRPDSPQSVIMGGQLTARKGTEEVLDFLTANDVLGGTFGARINMDLRETKGWSYGAWGVPLRDEGAVAYLVIAPVQADRTGDSIKAVRENVTAFLGDKGITEEEFERTINGAIRELAGSFETAGDVLGGMQRNDLYRRSDDYYDTIAQKYRAMTRPQLDAAARATLDPNKFVWVVVGDASKVKPQLDTLGLPVEVVPATPAAPAAPAN
jgi:predicted Zn-dependent peptidase